MTNSPQMPALSRSQILVAMAVTAIVLLAISKAWMYLFNVRMVPLHVSPVHFAVGLGLGVLITSLSSLIYEIWPGYRAAADNYLEMVLKPLEMPDLIWLGLLPGISEELLFRGVALPALGMNVLALFVSSIVFGGLHMGSLRHWPYTVWAMFVGLGLGAVTLATGSLLPAVVAHVFTNSTSGLWWKLKQAKLPG